MGITQNPHIPGHILYRIRISIFTIALAAMTIVPMLVDTPNTQAVTDCSPNGIALGGSSWLSGGGVNVCNHPGDESANYVNNINGVQTLSGYKWECVELVNRLYLTKGWTTATWYGNGNTLVNNVPSGLTKQNNGAISYVNSGDVITLDDGGFGHAGIINTTGSTYGIINQNADLNSSAYIQSGSLSTGNAFLHMNYWAGYTVQSIVHAPNVASSSPGTIYFVKTTNTGSGYVEVHSATPNSNYQSGMHVATWLSPADASNGWFQMVGPNLYFIKTKNTGSGRVEIHSATAASNYQSGIHSTTAFSPADANNGWFQMTSGGDLVFIKTTNTTSGRVEFFRASASSGYSQVVTATTTAFSPADASNGWFQAQGLDLVFIKTRNTSSGKVEYFRASASSNYQQITVATATAFSPADANNGWFSSEDVNLDGIAELIFIKTKNTASGLVELYIADGSRNYQQITSSNATWLSPADANNGWFQVDNKD